MLPKPTRTDRIGLSFGQYYKPHSVYHPGVDFNWGIGDQDKGQTVYTPASGVVEYVSPSGYNGGLGLYIVIYHPQFAVWTRYLHLDSTGVIYGQKLRQGDVIAVLGDSGTTSAHLHFEVLNHKGIQYIKDYYRPYGRYPTGLSKSSMMALWIDPEKWLRENTDPPVRKNKDEAMLLRTAIARTIDERRKKVLLERLNMLQEGK